MNQNSLLKIARLCRYLRINQKTYAFCRLLAVPSVQVRRRPPCADPVSSSSIIFQTSPVSVLPGPSWKQPWLVWGRSRSPPIHFILLLPNPIQHHHQTNISPNTSLHQFIPRTICFLKCVIISFSSFIFIDLRIQSPTQPICSQYLVVAIYCLLYFWLRSGNKHPIIIIIIIIIIITCFSIPSLNSWGRNWPV